MNLLLNILKALAIVLGVYSVLFASVCAMTWYREGRWWLSGIGWRISVEDWSMFLLFFVVLPFLLALGALYLPAEGRKYAAIAALLLILSILVWIGIQIASPPSE